MENGENKELEKIRRIKLQEMIRSAISDKQKIVSNKVIEITDTRLKEIIENNSLVVVDCWAPWCGPCSMIGPVIEEMAQDYAGKILFGKINVDENKRLCMQYEIMSIPTLLVFKNGELVDKIIGAIPRRLLETKITKHL